MHTFAGARRRWLGLVATLVALAAGFTTGTRPADAAIGVELIELGTLGGGSSNAMLIKGDIVVGSSLAADNATHAFATRLSDPSHTVIDLGTLGGTWAAPTAIDGTIVVGYASLPGDTVHHAFMVDVSDESPQMVDLGTLGGTNSIARDIEGSVIVGGADGPPWGFEQAFMYDLAADPPQMVALGTIGGGTSGASAIDGGVITGVAATSSWHYDAFTYDLNASSPSMVDRGNGGAMDANIVDIGGGVVVGSVSSYGTTEYYQHAAYLDLNASTPALTDIGTLGGAVGFAVDADDGIVLGNSQYDASGNYRGFIYDVHASEPQMIDIGSLGGAYTFALDLDGRFAVGYAYPRSSGERPFVYDLTTSTMRELPGGLYGAAQAVDGQYVVGHIRYGDGLPHAAVWRLYDLIDTTTSVGTSKSPSVVGEQVTYTATVTPAPDGGTVGFRANGSPIAGCETQPVDASTGIATCTVTLSTVGTRAITATYSGNQAYATSQSVSLSQQTSYAIKLLTNHSRPQRNRNPIDVELQLTDVLGTNLSSASVTVTVTGIAPDPAPGTAPSGTFDYVVVKKKPTYRDTLDVTGYPNGTYAVSFVATGDPVTHTFTFILR